LRWISRATVDAARPRTLAIDRIDSPATIEREISSRSARLSALAARRRSGGRIPPVVLKILWTEEWLRSKSWAIV